MSLYLTDIEKENELATLGCLFENANPYENDGLDIEMAYYLKRLNRLKGLVTVQSCSGHFYKPDAYTQGHLWIRLSREAVEKVQDSLCELASCDWIESVSLDFKKYGQVVLEIVFDSKHSGTVRFYEAMESIATYFENVLPRERGELE